MTSPFGAWKTLALPGGARRVADLGTLAEATGRDLARLPYSIKILLENALRHCGRGLVEERDVLALLDWDASSTERGEVAFMPARVLLQDLTGVPCVVDLAALRSAIARAGGDPLVVKPTVPVDLVVDHSLQVDCTGKADACRLNMELEMERNGERYALLRWAQDEFANLRVIPPGTGICHQVNLEYLAEVVRVDGRGRAMTAAASHATSGRAVPGAAVVTLRAAMAALVTAADRLTNRLVGAGRIRWAYPDTVVGTDSHTTMINGLGVLGWGVGGIEAEAAMLGQPYYMLVPQVVGVRLIGRLHEKATATDLVLTVTELLREVGVVGRFVEFFGPSAEELSVADRATLANMSPEYGATCGFFPVDGETVSYLRKTGRSQSLSARVEAYCRSQGLFREPGSDDPEYSAVVELDLAEVRACLAGPRRPQDRVPLEGMPKRLREDLPSLVRGRKKPAKTKVEIDGKREIIRDGHVVIASITGCTNTSNPVSMLAAGLVARKALALGLTPKRWVRASLAPGSRTVSSYLDQAGLLEPLESLGFSVVGYGCATCIGNSGPLPEGLARAIKDKKLVVAAVLSGNRNFEARIHPRVRANYLASPPLVVAYALAGTVNIDLASEPLGTRGDGRPVYLRDLWPTAEGLAGLANAALRPEVFRREYAAALMGPEAWRAIPAPSGALYAWDEKSTYVQEPPFLEGVSIKPAPPGDVHGARVLAIFGDSVTTDHISPAGSIARQSPAGRYLAERGVRSADFHTYGARRGNHEVLVRGTFANAQLRNRMSGEREGGWTTHHPSGESVRIYDAAMRYRAESVPLVIFAGKEYGIGSSRDWAAKGPALLGVRAVIAESFERIHRCNLVGMGVLPLELEPGTTVESLGLDGSEFVDISGISPMMAPADAAEAVVTVRVRRGVSSGGAGEGGLGVESGQAGDAVDASAADIGGKEDTGEQEESGGNVKKGAARRKAESSPGAAMTRDFTLPCRVRLDSAMDVEYFQHGGVLPRILRQKLASKRGPV